MKKLLLCSLLIAHCSLLFAQTADRIEWLLQQSLVSYEQAALLVLEAAGWHERYGREIIASPEAAFDFARQQNMLPRNAAANHAATYKGLSFLIMQAFDMRGGFFYTLTRSQHHAYRELVRLGIIQGRADPLKLITGDNLLFTVSRAIFLTTNHTNLFNH